MPTENIFAGNIYFIQPKLIALKALLFASRQNYINQIASAVLQGRKKMV